LKELPEITIKPGSEVILTASYGVFQKYKVLHVKDTEDGNILIVLEKKEDLP